MADQFLTIHQVMERTALGRSTIYDLKKRGVFPEPVPLHSPHIVRWLASEIDAWQQARIREARGTAQPAQLAGAA